MRVDVLLIADESGQLCSAAPRCGVTLDLNERGCLCAHVGYLPLSSLVHIFLRLPDQPENPIGCYARVVRCDLVNEPLYGLKMVALAPSDTVRLREFANRDDARPALSWMYRFAS